jgi:hypothetical protein
LQAIDWQPAPDARWCAGQIRAPPPLTTTLYRLVHQHAAIFFAEAEAEAAAASDLAQFVKNEFDVFLKFGILAHGFLRLRSGDCGHDKLVAFSCKRPGFCPSCVARRMAQTAQHLWIRSSLMCHCAGGCSSLSIPLRLLPCCWPRSRSGSRQWLEVGPARAHAPPGRLNRAQGGGGRQRRDDAVHRRSDCADAGEGGTRHTQTRPSLTRLQTKIFTPETVRVRAAG